MQLTAIHRPIKSFVRRMGRLTNAQKDALNTLWPLYGVPADTLNATLTEWWQSTIPITVEIGFGDGECLTTLASRHPERNFLGFEVHDPGVGHALIQAHKLKLNNLRIIHDDAQTVLADAIPAQSLSEVLIYFPDPWHKKRHHKRRLIQPAFLELLSRLLKPSGVVRLATDWPDYAAAMVEAFAAVPQFDNQAHPAQFIPRPPERPETKFERRGLRLGQPAWDLCFVRNSKICPPLTTTPLDTMHHP